MSQASSSRITTNAQNSNYCSTPAQPQHGIRFFNLAGVEQENLVLTPSIYGFFDETSGNPYMQYGAHQSQKEKPFREVCSENKLTLKNRPSKSKTRQDFSTPKHKPFEVIDLLTPPPVRQPLFLHSPVASIQPHQLFAAPAKPPTLQNNRVQTVVPQGTIPSTNPRLLTLSVETLPQTAQDEHASYEAGPLAAGGDKGEVDSANPPQTDEENPGTASQEAGPLAAGGDKGEVDPANPPQIDEESDLCSSASLHFSSICCFYSFI
ncbi:uncharacterized protein LOC118557913 [Fundulus heteroclitus]|uniref:uncharacterized protein LOC118557913 n=1 Tax=Fundulus heteroclitus TaxID=8078 RepID=UPI00165AF8DF|nr:uncharacterized protein LOC118557913 [Fundulus heteroclitus]